MREIDFSANALRSANKKLAEKEVRIEQLERLLETAVNAAGVFLDGGDMGAMQALEEWIVEARQALEQKP